MIEIGGGSPCPHCGTVLDAHVLPVGADRSGFDLDATPFPGDATVCTVCDSILIFDGDLQLRMPTEEEKRLIFRSFDDEKRIS